MSGVRQRIRFSLCLNLLRKLVFFLDDSFLLLGIAEPRAPSFFGTLVQDNMRARYVQDISSFEYSVRLEELGGFFRDQRWMHMHDVLRGQGFTFQELGHQGGEAALAILKDEGFTREEVLREIGKRKRRGALASLEAQGFTGEGGAASASTELGRRGGEASSAIYRISGNCTYPGCTYAISSGEFCEKHNPPKPAKSDKCRVCGRVFVAKEQVRAGVCNPCYQKPEAVARCNKAKADKNAARGTCSTPGCNGIKDRGRGKCYTCSKKST
jgi:hypothetical protein